MSETKKSKLWRIELRAPGMAAGSEITLDMVTPVDKWIAIWSAAVWISREAFNLRIKPVLLDKNLFVEAKDGDREVGTVASDDQLRTRTGDGPGPEVPRAGF